MSFKHALAVVQWRVAFASNPIDIKNIMSNTAREMRANATQQEE